MLEVTDMHGAVAELSRRTVDSSEPFSRSEAMAIRLEAMASRYGGQERPLTTIQSLIWNGRQELCQPLAPGVSGFRSQSVLAGRRIPTRRVSTQPKGTGSPSPKDKRERGRVGPTS